MAIIRFNPTLDNAPRIVPAVLPAIIRFVDTHSTQDIPLIVDASTVSYTQEDTEYSDANYQAWYRDFSAAGAAEHAADLRNHPQFEIDILDLEAEERRFAEQNRQVATQYILRKSFSRRLLLTHTDYVSSSRRSARQWQDPVGAADLFSSTPQVAEPVTIFSAMSAREFDQWNRKTDAYNRDHGIVVVGGLDIQRTPEYLARQAAADLIRRAADAAHQLDAEMDAQLPDWDFNWGD